MRLEDIKWPTPEYSHATYNDYCGDPDNRGRGKRPPEPGTLDECRALEPEITERVELLVAARTRRELSDEQLIGTRKRQKRAIPPLKVGRIQQYIAAVARAVAAGDLTATQGNGLLYAAQLAIAASKVMAKPTPTQPTGESVRNALANAAGSFTRGISGVR